MMEMYAGLPSPLMLFIMFVGRLWAEIFDVQEHDGDVCWAAISTDVVPSFFRLWAEIFEVQEHDGDVFWAAVSTDVVPSCFRLWVEIFEVQEHDGDVCWAAVSTDVVPSCLSAGCGLRSLRSKNMMEMYAGLPFPLMLILMF